ncbi:hypothetical protein KIN20_006319 [Parelaphostrongylus tenuis]|uniref:Uncharacterized protein n=1 Tax=Parelaphostrongylus tenuis TaxID=148309 RepID=A0AAD5QFW4_PARTN|nr:hypothetical protein KIN20_006319 [Parelaphostrongylus tenuis]
MIQETFIFLNKSDTNISGSKGMKTNHRTEQLCLRGTDADDEQISFLLVLSDHRAISVKTSTSAIFPGPITDHENVVVDN